MKMFYLLALFFFSDLHAMDKDEEKILIQEACEGFVEVAIDAGLVWEDLLKWSSSSIQEIEEKTE